MTVELHKLSNGVSVALDHMPHTRNAALGMYFTVGSRMETPENGGVAHFYEHVVFKGTESRQAEEIDNEIEGMGASSNATTDREVTCYYVSGRAVHMNAFAKVLGDIVCNSTLPPDEVERERVPILAELAACQDDPESSMGNYMFQTAFPGQSFGAPTGGTPEIVLGMSRDTIKAFKDEHYHAGNLIVSAAGNLPGGLLAELENTVGRLPVRLKSAFTPAVYKGGDFHDERDLSMLNMILLFPGFPLRDPRSTATEVLAAALGGGASSRLFQEIRGKRGLVYTVASGHESAHDAAGFFIHAAVKEEQVRELMPVLCEEINRVRKDGFTDAEIARAKEQLQSSLAQAEDSVTSRMDMAARELIYKGYISFPGELERNIDSITGADVKNVANHVFSGVPTFVTVGPGQHRANYAGLVQKLTL